MVALIFTGDGLGEWVKCDDGWIGEELSCDYHFYDTPNFNIKSAHTGTLAVRLCIKIEGNVHIIYCMWYHIAPNFRSLKFS